MTSAYTSFGGAPLDASAARRPAPDELVRRHAHPGRVADGDPARDPGRSRLRAARRRRAARACAEPVARRGARRHHLLPPLPHASRRRASPCSCAAPKRAAAWAPKRSRSTSKAHTGCRFDSGHQHGATVELESVYLPRPMRAVAGDDDQRRRCTPGSRRRSSTRSSPPRSTNAWR